MDIPYLSLQRITALHGDEIQTAVDNVVKSGWYLHGEATTRFETEYARYIGTRYCVGCGNGLDALTLIFRAYKELGRLKDGDEVLVPANTFIATLLSITENGLVPVLVEPGMDSLEIDDTRLEAALTARTRAVMIVHLYGRSAWTPRIADLCRRHHLLLLEDNAQAHGCQVAVSEKGESSMVRTGSLGDAAAHSFYPGKNLGALGDAGAVTTSDEALAGMLRTLGNYGSSRKYVFPYKGRNSRLDEIQAAVLSVRLRYLDEDNQRRRDIAHYYQQHIVHPSIRLPYQQDRAVDNVFHIFPVFCHQRDGLQQYLKERGIGTQIHYPIPPHHQECYREWASLSLPVTEELHLTELSLPCNQAMTDGEVERVVEVINQWPNR